MNDAPIPSPQLDYFQIYIKKSIEERAKDLINQEAKEAAARIETKIRELLPGIVMSMFDSYSAIWEDKKTLCIRVEIKEPKTNA